VDRPAQGRGRPAPASDGAPVADAAAALSPHIITPAERRREGAPRLRIAILDPDGIAQVRRLVRDLVGIDMPPRRRADALLAVTELVTNSLVHAGSGPITLWAWLDANRLRVEVHDAGPGIPPDRQWMLPGADNGNGTDAGGRGLALVRMIADRSGHRTLPWAKVWFEMDIANRNGRH
jgi:anti-sigma regulatory factor (Ser/Thr protein kinase)